MVQSRRLIIICLSLFLSACSGSGGNNATIAAPAMVNSGGNNSGAISDTFDALVTADKTQFNEVSSRSLFADGDGIGLTAYELIRDLGGNNNIESPDLYSINHPGVPHIYEALDPEIGEHFVFVIHRDEDRDRDRLDINDRQRNEIKTYSSSEDAVLGYEGEIMVFTWKFRINENMEVSRNFTHFFQLKAVGGPDSQPVLTITGNESSSEDGMEIRHSALVDTNRLARIAWSEVTGEWLEVYCRARFDDEGELRLIVSRMRDDEVLFDITETNIDLWRGDSTEHFVRPKWGIYRSLRDITNLRADEEDVRFADFVVEKVVVNDV